MYGIMRVEKRGRTDVYGIQLEANRTLEQHANGIDFDKSDIDWNKTNDNIFLVHTENWNSDITKVIKRIEADTGKKTRKDAVVLLDGLFTATNEFFNDKTTDEIKKYFEDCLSFYIKEFCQGDKSRVLNAVIHLDEATPHMQVASIPIFTSDLGDRLNAKIIMGNKTDYRKRQDRFFNDVSSKYGLERGEPASAANKKVHTTKREWQAAVQEEIIIKNDILIKNQTAEITQLKEQLKETSDKIERLEKKVHNSGQLKLVIENAQLESENTNLKKENAFLKNTINIINQYIENHPNVLPGFIVNQIKKVKEKHNHIDQSRPH